MEYGVRLLLGRLAILAGFVGVFGFALAAVFPGGGDTTFVVLAVICALVAMSALGYVIRVHRKAQRGGNRRPEDVTSG